MVEIREVKTKKERKEFIEFPLNLYKGVEYFVPPLYGDEKKIFSPSYVYYDQSEAVYYNAYKGGKIVGRISGILQRASNDKWGQKRVRFTRFDAIDDQEVADALFKTVEEWAKSKGMEEVVGPLGFSDLEREGLLIDGFDQVSTFEEQYNYPYYQKLIENCGYGKDVDWFERKLYKFKGDADRIYSLSEKMLKRYNLHFSDAKSGNEFIDRYADEFFRILDETYDKIYGTVPFTDGMKKMMIDNFRLFIDIRYVYAILDKDEKIVAFGLSFPAIGEALQKSGGRLTLPAIIRLFKALKHPKVIDLGLVGVIDEYRNKGVATAILAKLIEPLVSGEIDHYETNLNLEDNLAIQNQWGMFENVLHKRRRCFVKKI